MDIQGYTTIGLSAAGMAISWGVWVSVSVFKHAQEIALIRQEITVLTEVKDVLSDIREELHKKSGRHNG